MLKKILVIIFVLFVTNIFAVDSSVTSTDVSLNYLRMIFGTVGNSLVAIANPADNLVAGLFNIFNMGIMVFAGGFISYTVYNNTINTAQDGGLAASGKSNAWPAFRIILGLALISPMYNGYSMMQETVMWAAVSGVNVASSIWQESVEHIAKTGGGILAPARETEDVDLYKIIANVSSNKQSWNVAKAGSTASMSDMMASASCLAVVAKKAEDEINLITTKLGGTLNNAFDARVRTGADCTAVAYNGKVNPKIPTTVDNTVCFGVATNPSVCGSYSWSMQDSLMSDIEKDKVNIQLKNFLYKVGVAYFNSMQNQYKSVLGFLEKHAVRANNDFSTLESAKVALEKDNNLEFICDKKNLRCFLSVDITDDSKRYLDIISFLRLKPEEKTDGQKNIQDWAKKATATGWILAGQSYSDFVSTDNVPLSKLEAIEGFQLKVNDPINSKYINLISDQSIFSCIQEKSSTAAAITLNNLGKSIGDLNNTSLTGGTLTFDPKGKYQVGACILVNTLSKMSDIALTISAKSLDTSSVGNEAMSSNLLANNLDKVTGAALKILLEENIFQSIQSKNEVLLGQPVYLDVVEDNLTAMILNIYSKMIGFYPFSNNKEGSSLAATFSDGSDNASGEIFTNSLNNDCLTARDLCLQVENENYKGCFQFATVSCIKEGQGILGSLYKGQKGGVVDQVMLLSNLGINMLNNAVLYWTQTSKGVYVIGTTLAKRYMAAMGVMAGAGSALVIAQAATSMGKLESTLFGLSQLILSATNQFLSIEFKYVLLSVGMYLPFGATLAAIFFGLGVTLGLYLPLIPFVTFLFGAIGWIIAVIEAMIAAPLISLGLTHPVGHDLLGKAEQAVMLLLSVFVRPAAMVIGFIFSIALIFVAMEIFNIGFLSVIVNYMSNISNISSDGERATIMIGFCGLLLVYGYIALNVVNQCFSLIYLVPEKLLRWIGGAPEFSYTSQLLQDVHSGAKDSGSQVAQGAGDTGKTPAVRPSIQAQIDMKLEDKRDSEGNLIYNDKGQKIKVGWYDKIKQSQESGVEDKKNASNSKGEGASIEMQPIKTLDEKKGKDT
jgi:hypothetical protein